MNPKLRKTLKSFTYAAKGISSVIRGETNMKIHLVVAVLVVIFGLLLCISVLEWIACLLCVALVTTAEMFNTAIESVVDLISPDRHPLAGKAKDIAAGAVLICAIISVIIGILIFAPKLWCLILG